MANTGINLADKTVVLAGPFGLLLQTLASALAEHGSDVAILTNDSKGAMRFSQNLSDLREVSEKFGRAAAFDCNFQDQKDIQAGFGRAAEAFGTIDAFIDTNFFSSTPAEAKKVADRVQLLASSAIPFLKHRGRGRIVYYGHASSLLAGELSVYVQKLATELAADSVTVNAVALGATEEFLLKAYPSAKTIQAALREHQAQHPRAKLVDYKDAVQVGIFIISALGAAINGQLIKVNHGVDL